MRKKNKNNGDSNYHLDIKLLNWRKEPRASKIYKYLEVIGNKWHLNKWKNSKTWKIT